MAQVFVVTKYNGKWSILDLLSCVYYNIGDTRKHCENRCKELNEEIKNNDYEIDLWLN